MWKWVPSFWPPAMRFFDTRRIPEYGYGRIPNVITAIEFERFLSASGPTHGHVYRPTDLALAAKLPELEKAHQRALKGLEKFEKNFGRTSNEFLPLHEAGELAGGDYDKWAEQARAARKVGEELEALRAQVDKIELAHRLAFIQCVGSRDIRFNRFCSGFCCMHAIKEAIIAKEHDGKAEVFILGMDIRAGKGFRGISKPWRPGIGGSSISAVGWLRSPRMRVTT